MARDTQDPAGPPLVQLLTPEGIRVDDPAYPLDISDDEIGRLYRDMALTRRFDAEATALQRQGELGLWVPSLGQEAAQVGAARAARPHDMIFPTYREHGMAQVRGVDLLHLIELFRGTSLGDWDVEATRFGQYTIVIGAQTLHAVGYAMGVAADGDIGTGEPDRDTAVLACFGDGASAQGDVSEAMVWAAARHLPVVFYCQNNQWAISEPVERQSPVPLYQRAAGFGFPGVRIDGNDVLACLAVTRSVMDEARSGQGPVLIEAFTYRMGAHTTSDDPTRYRTVTDLEQWRQRDPLGRVRTYLESAGVGDDFFAEVGNECDALAALVRTETVALPDPAPVEAFAHVYAEMTDELAEQRDAYARYLDSFDVPVTAGGVR